MPKFLVEPTLWSIQVDHKIRTTRIVTDMGFGTPFKLSRLLDWLCVHLDNENLLAVDQIDRMIIWVASYRPITMHK